MNLIAKEWESLKAKCISPEADEIEIQECRRMFYAGAMAAATLIRCQEATFIDIRHECMLFCAKINETPGY